MYSNAALILDAMPTATALSKLLPLRGSLTRLTIRSGFLGDDIAALAAGVGLRRLQMGRNDPRSATASSDLITLKSMTLDCINNYGMRL